MSDFQWMEIILFVATIVAICNLILLIDIARNKK